MTENIAYQDWASGGPESQAVGMTKPLPVSMRPSQYDGNGHYSMDVATGSMAAGAATRTIWWCRNTSAAILVAVSELSIQGLIATTAFAAGQILISAFVARSFTSIGTPGGTAATLTGNNQKVRTSMATPQISEIRAATTVGIVTPTWTLDSQAIGEINTHSSAGWQGATPIIGSVYMPDNELYCAQPHEHPLILAQNEGLMVQCLVPATGVWIASVRLKWSELNAY